MLTIVNRLTVLLVASGLLVSCSQGAEMWSCSGAIESIEIDHQNKTVLVHLSEEGQFGVEFLQVNNKIAFDILKIPFSFDTQTGDFGYTKGFHARGCRKIEKDSGEKR